MSDTMNIYAQNGDKIKYVHENSGYDYDKAQAKKYLKLNQIYTVKETIIHSSSTDVYLHEVPDILFNSVLFEDYNFDHMTKCNHHNEMIAKQQIEIESLKIERTKYYEQLKQIELMLICIGGPLNDNFCRYNKKQLQIFYRIQAVLDED